MLEKRNYEEAGAVFSDFLKANPTDPLADNARYWLGETYYARGEYGRSAEIFLEGYEKNKTGPKAPDTLLKLGLSLSALDKKKEACASFRELKWAFPNAPESVKEKAGQGSNAWVAAEPSADMTLDAVVSAFTRRWKRLPRSRIRLIWPSCCWAALIACRFACLRATGPPGEVAASPP